MRFAFGASALFVLLFGGRDAIASPAVKLRAYDSKATSSSIGTGFVTADPRFTSNGSRYALVTALHVLHHAGFSADRVDVMGDRQIKVSNEFVAWPGQDLAALPLDQSDLDSLGTDVLSIAEPQRIVGLRATLAHRAAAPASLSGEIAGEVITGVYADSIKVHSGGRDAIALRRLSRDTQLVVSQMLTEAGMSGAPVTLGEGGPVVAVHCMGVRDGGKYPHVGFAISLLGSSFLPGIPLRQLPPAPPGDDGPYLQQSDIESLPPDIRERLARMRDLVEVSSNGNGTTGGEATEGGGQTSMSAFLYAFGSMPVRSDLAPGSSRVGVLVEKVPSGALPREIGRSGFSFSLFMNLTYAREVRIVGGATEAMNGMGFAVSLGPCHYWINPEAMSAFVLTIGPVLDLVAFHLRALEQPGEQHFAYGGTVSARWISLPMHLSVVVHASAVSRAVALHQVGALGRELGLDLGVGVGPVW